MNKTRRKRIEALLTALSEIIDEVESLRDEEQEYLYNIPENLQSSERYAIAENAASNLEEAACDLQNALEELENAAE